MSLGFKRLILFRESITACSENHTKQRYIVSAKCRGPYIGTHTMYSYHSVLKSSSLNCSGIDLLIKSHKGNFEIKTKKFTLAIPL